MKNFVFAAYDPTYHERFDNFSPCWGDAQYGTEKKGSILFFLRPFLTRIFFQEILGLERSKISWEKNPSLTRKFSGEIS